MLLTEIDHVAIAVSDLEAAIDYYRRAFGADHQRRELRRVGVGEGAATTRAPRRSTVTASA